MQMVLKWTSVLIVAAAIGVLIKPDLVPAIGLSGDDTARINNAFKNHTSNIVVEAPAQVSRLMPDLVDVEKHQVFFVELESGQRIKVMHNLDEAPPVPVVVGSNIRLRGEYDWTPEGGVIHWTHHDPKGQREGGWIEYQDHIYR